MIFVPPPFAADAIVEAADAGVSRDRLHHRGHPDQRHAARERRSSTGRPPPARPCGSSGPNCPGIITPGECKIGIMPGRIHRPGIGRRDLALGHAHVRGRRSAHAARPRPVDGHRHRRRSRSTGPTSSTASTAFRDDPATEAVVLIGEIGGMAEEEAACWVAGNFQKPVVSFIAGQTAPPGRRMGHAGAIIAGGQGTAAEKMQGARGRRDRRGPVSGRHRGARAGVPRRMNGPVLFEETQSFSPWIYGLVGVHPRDPDLGPVGRARRRR